MEIEERKERKKKRKRKRKKKKKNLQEEAKVKELSPLGTIGLCIFVRAE